MNKIRNGNFTSSEIFRLMGKKTIDTYIAECNMERRLGRSLDQDSNARPLIWGKVAEAFLFQQLGTEYRICSQETIQHPEIEYWVGSPDLEKHASKKTVCEIKCPQTLKSFVQLVQPLYEERSGIGAMNYIRDNHKDGEKFWWQIISNAILIGADVAELIVFAPYKKQLNKLRDFLSDELDDVFLMQKAAWINWSDDNELPYLPDNGFYKNINVIQFEVPQSDKTLLTEKVIESGKLLINQPSILLATQPEEGVTMVTKENY